MSVPVHVDGVHKRFDAFPALRGVSLDIAGGELVALLGPSGSGKTTLLRVIAGLETVDSGRVLFGGTDMNSLSLRDRRIGFVFQHYALFKTMNVADNIAFGLRARPRRERPAAAEISRRVNALLELVQLQGLNDRFPAQLSGGQRQRVALARALAIEPRVLLLDEPFGALDAKVRKDLRGWLRDLHRRTGHTTVFVTHDQEEALELADRVAILNQGLIEQVGTPDAVYDQPETAFVCAFLGEANALPVTVAGGRILFANAPVSRAQRPDGAATFFVRPHDLIPAAAGTEAFEGRIIQLRRSGGIRRADVAVEGIDHPVHVDLPADAPHAAGSALRLSVATGHLFPAA